VFNLAGIGRRINDPKLCRLLNCTDSKVAALRAAGRSWRDIAEQLGSTSAHFTMLFLIVKNSVPPFR